MRLTLLYSKDLDRGDAGGLLVAEEILRVRTQTAVCRERDVLCRGGAQRRREGSLAPPRTYILH